MRPANSRRQSSGCNLTQHETRQETNEGQASPGELDEQQRWCWCWADCAAPHQVAIRPRFKQETRKESHSDADASSGISPWLLAGPVVVLVVKGSQGRRALRGWVLAGALRSQNKLEELGPRLPLGGFADARVGSHTAYCALLTLPLIQTASCKTRLVSPRLHCTMSLYRQHHFQQPHPFPTLFPAPICPSDSVSAFFLASAHLHRNSTFVHRRRQHRAPRPY